MSFYVVHLPHSDCFGNLDILENVFTFQLWWWFIFCEKEFYVLWFFYYCFCVNNSGGVIRLSVSGKARFFASVQFLYSSKNSLKSVKIYIL